MDYWWWREQEGIDLEVARSALEAAEAVLEACERHGVLLQRLERARHSHAAMVISEPGVLGAWPSGAAMVISELRTEADALSAILEGVAPLLNTSGDAGL